LKTGARACGFESRGEELENNFSTRLYASQKKSLRVALAAKSKKRAAKPNFAVDAKLRNKPIYRAGLAKRQGIGLVIRRARVACCHGEP
jgi:hypothetical protein